MSARNRRAGKEWERQLKNGYRASGHDTEHHRDTGTKDEGDLILRVGNYHFVCEAKNAALNVTGFLSEASVEAEHYAASRTYVDPENVFPFVDWKRKGKTFDGGVVMLEREVWLRILNVIKELSK